MAFWVVNIYKYTLIDSFQGSAGSLNSATNCATVLSKKVRVGAAAFKVDKLLCESVNSFDLDSPELPFLI